MKTNNTLFTLATALVLWATGCERQDATVQQDMQNAATEAAAAMKNVAGAAKQTGQQVAQDVKEAGQKVATEVAAKANELAATGSTKVQEILDGAKKLVSDGKLQNALAQLKELGGEKLSAEQQALVDGLKAQIDKLLGASSKAATDAANAAGKLLKK